MIDEVSRAYSRRAAEYIELLGSMTAVHPSDLQLISTWASGVKGEVIDAGCGPGHWTNFLAQHNLDARGVDPVPEFIAHAKNNYPELNFTLGTIESLGAFTDSVGGVLAWYSLIHHEPKVIRVPLLEISRALRPGGTLVVGFLESTALEEYAHAVTPAWRWPVDLLSAELNAAGFDVVETHVRKTVGELPQGAIIARCRAIR